MKRIATLILGLLSILPAALAQSTTPTTGAINGYCTQGGVPAKTQGLGSTNTLQGIIPACTVTVYLTGTHILATLTSDAAGDVLSNPFTASPLGSASPGQWVFFAATSQNYDIVLTGGIPPNVYTQPVSLIDVGNAGGSGGGGGGSGSPNPIVTFINATSWTMPYSTYFFVSNGIITACYDSLGNQFEPGQVTITAVGVSDYTIAFTVASPVSGYCTANSYSSGQGGGIGYQTPNVLLKGNGNLFPLGSSLTDTGTLLTGTEPTQFNSYLVSQVDNGVINPTLFPGSDLAQQITSAIAAGCPAPSTGGAPSCVIKVPPSLTPYTITSGGIILPGLGAVLHLDLSNADLVFSGSAITYGLSLAPFSNRVYITGGRISMAAAPNAKAGVVLGYGAQGIYIDGLNEIGAANGDGLVNFGANVVHITNSTFSQNLIGVHLLGSPGYASNANSIDHNVISQNARYGIADGDISQYPVGWPIGNGTYWTSVGSSSPNFNNTIENNDLEVNGTSSTSSSNYYPAVLFALTNGESLHDNYFESTPYNEITAGCNARTPDSYYTNLYGISAANSVNCGTAQGPNIRHNYFTTAGGSEIYLFASNHADVEDNTDASSVTNTCFLAASIAINTHENNNNYSATNHWCVAASLSSPGPLTAEGWAMSFGPYMFDLPAGTFSDAFYFNGAYGATGSQAFRMTSLGPPSPNNPANPGSNPYCTPAYSIGNIWVDTTNGNRFKCTATTNVIPNLTFSPGVWVLDSVAQGCMQLGNPVNSSIAACAVAAQPTGSCSVTGQMDIWVNGSTSGISLCSGGTWVAH